MHKDQCLLYASGEMSAQEAAAFEGHLPSCPDCRAWLDVIRQGSAWAKAGRVGAPAALKAKSLRRFTSVPPPPPETGPQGGGGPAPGGLLGWSILALISALAAAGLFLSRGHRERIRPGLPSAPEAGPVGAPQTWPERRPSASRLGSSTTTRPPTYSGRPAGIGAYVTEAAPAPSIRPSPPRTPAAREPAAETRRPPAVESRCEVGSVHAMMAAAFAAAKKHLGAPKLYSIQRFQDDAVGSVMAWLSLSYAGEFRWEIVFFDPASRHFLYFIHGRKNPIKYVAVRPLKEYDGGGQALASSLEDSSGQLYKVSAAWGFDAESQTWSNMLLGNTYLSIGEQRCGQIDGAFLDSTEVQASLPALGENLCGENDTLISLFHPLPPSAPGKRCKGYSLFGPSQKVWDAVPDSLSGGNLWGVLTDERNVLLLDAASGRVLHRETQK